MTAYTQSTIKWKACQFLNWREKKHGIRWRRRSGEHNAVWGNPAHSGIGANYSEVAPVDLQFAFNERRGRGVWR